MADPADAVVGIGASAGGLDAFRGFFENLSTGSGLAFVVVLHLPHDRKSMLPEILGRWTRMPVREAEDDTRLEANHVYVPPPNTVITVADGILGIRQRDSDAPRNDRPIDDFFDSLAAGLRDRAIGVVLSGTGSDGALGLKAIKAVGGLTFAQGSDGSHPQYDGMPLGAIATGAVDLVVPVEAMPAELVRLHLAREQIGKPPAESPDQVETLRLRICAILRARLGHDFSGYKDKTFLRRVQRRMQLLDLDTMSDYVERLDRNHDEAVGLFKDLLIRVTSFFRDAETFDVLAREVMPRLFEGKHADDTVRVWVPGCATGEEAYSLAILLREHLDGLLAAPKVQLFATDIDEPAIATARAGRYPSTLLDGLSPERRRRFFNQVDGASIVTKEIRDLCTFSAHSLVRDPPFSRMNMISCRNLLIYLDTAMQGSIIPAFHYSLARSGILLLGSSESTARHEDLFTPLNQAARVFVRRDVRTPRTAFAHGSRLTERAAETLRSATSGRGAAPAGGGHEPARWDGRGDTRRPGAPRRLTVRGLARRAGIELLDGLHAARTWLPAGAVESERQRRELHRTQRELQSMTEEHGTALEELRSANEELHSVNEELQSTNEELETSKEEIQSVNEELHTVNAQLSEKVDELDRAASDLKNLFDSTEVATIFLDRHLIIRGFTPAVCSIYNLIPSDQGRPLIDIVSQLQYDGLREDMRTVLETLEPLERRLARRDRDTHYIMRILPYRARDSSVDGALVTFIDVTSVVQAESHQRLLVDELNHRVKNMLTVVISLASQTLRRADSLETFSETFMGRIKALTASYSLLSRANWTDIELREVLTEEVRPFLSRQQDNIILDGPAIRLAPQGALALGMAVHELVTNAVKYGALSSPEGSVHVRWRVEPEPPAPTFVLDWVESGGPPVGRPVSQGFGTTLIERGFAHELSGSATIDFAADGVRATLRAPIGQAVLAETGVEQAGLERHP